jgi:hypothetical protein
MVWVKDWKKELLHPSWMSPHLSTVVKVAGITPWIHCSWIRKAATPTEPNDCQAVHDSTNPLRIRFQRRSQQDTIT